MNTSAGGHDRRMDAWKAWLVKARERFIEFFERRALVTRAQISLARMKHAEEEKPRHGKSQDLKG
jgi:hypothetical protein